MLFLFVTSCEQEEIFESQQVEQTTERKFKIKQYTFKEIESKPIIKETFQIFDKTVSTNIKSKSVMEKMYKFTIDSSRINEIQAENYTSYTISIKRDYETKGYFENLVIEKDSLNNINAYIIKYTPNAEIQINTEHNSFYFEGERSIKKIIYDDSSVANKITDTHCYPVIEMWCSWSYDHIAQNSCFKGSHLFIKWVEECPEGSGGDDNPKAGGTSSTSGNDESNPIVTAPIGDDMEGEGVINELTNLCGSKIFSDLQLLSIELGSPPGSNPINPNVTLSDYILNLFKPLKNFNYTIQNDYLSSSNAVTMGVRGNIETTISDSYLASATELSIARTIIHELVHAYILYQGTMNQDFVLSLKDYAIRNGYTYGHTNDFHHEVMGQYVTLMANALFYWDKDFGKGGTLGTQYYIDMAYAGLFTLDSDGNFNSQTDAFLDLVPIKEDRDRVKKIVLSESKADSNSKGTKCN